MMAPDAAFASDAIYGAPPAATSASRNRRFSASSSLMRSGVIPAPGANVQGRLSVDVRQEYEEFRRIDGLLVPLKTRALSGDSFELEEKDVLVLMDLIRVHLDDPPATGTKDS